MAIYQKYGFAIDQILSENQALPNATSGEHQVMPDYQTESDLSRIHIFDKQPLFTFLLIQSSSFGSDQSVFPMDRDATPSSYIIVIVR